MQMLRQIRGRGDSAIVYDPAVSTHAVKTQVWFAVSIHLLVVALRQCGTRSRTMRTRGKGRFFMSQTRKIITSAAFMRAAAVCSRSSCISLAERAVMIEVIC
jgi:hypothetical protein